MVGGRPFRIQFQLSALARPDAECLHAVLWPASTTLQSGRYGLSHCKRRQNNLKYISFINTEIARQLPHLQVTVKWFIQCKSTNDSF